jgi:hypothetical protein
LPAQQVLTDGINVSSLGASGLREVQLPPVGDRERQTLKSSNGAEAALRLSVEPDNGTGQSSITLAPLALPGETRVWVRHTGPPRQYRLSLKGPDLNLRADVSGTVQMAIPGKGIERFDFASPDAVLLQSGGNEVDLDLVLPEKTSSSLSSMAASAFLFHIDEFLDTNKTLVRRVSTILSGTLYLSHSTIRTQTETGRGDSFRGYRG